MKKYLAGTSAGFNQQETAMKNMHALALCAILTPTFVLASGSAVAKEPRTTAQKEQTKELTQQQNPQFTEREQPLTQRQNPQNLDNPAVRDTDLASSQATLTSVDRSKTQATTAKRTGHDTMGHDKFLSNKPTRGFHADQLIGMEVKGQADGDDLGTINDLIIDENGQVVAVVVGVGGFLGMGERDVAIGWDSLQRTAKVDDDDGFDYRFVTTKDSLKSAPEYKRY